jgi:WD40 repeat protein
MLIHKLKFNPHVVWSKDNEFHVFGYCNGNYHYLNANSSKAALWDRSRFIYGYPANVHHFNKVVKSANWVELVRYGVYAVLSNELNLTFAEFTTEQYSNQHSIIKETFPVGYRTIEKEEDGKTYIVQTTANFDKRDNDYVFAWGSSLVHERNGKCRIIKEPYQREQGHVSVTDAKFSPNGDKIAVAVKDGIRFLDPESLQCERELSVQGYKIHFLSYSEDGLTIAAITTCRKLIIWDID